MYFSKCNKGLSISADKYYIKLTKQWLNNTRNYFKLMLACEVIFSILGVSDVSKGCLYSLVLLTFLPLTPPKKHRQEPCSVCPVISVTVKLAVTSHLLSLSVGLTHVESTACPLKGRQPSGLEALCKRGNFLG